MTQAPGAARLEREEDRPRTTGRVAGLLADMPDDSEVIALANGENRDDLALKTLDVLYDEARFHREQATHHHQRMLYHFVELGRRIIEIRERVPHGEFIATVTSEIGVSQPHAWRLMELSRNHSRVNDLPPETSVRAALETIHEARRAERSATVAARVYRPVELPNGVMVEVGDAADLPIPDEMADLIVTSPPYGLGVDYATTDDNEGYTTYLRHAAAWAEEMYRVAKPQGRIALNVPLDVTYGGVKPLYADWVNALIDADWHYRFSVVWNEGNISATTARGSVDSPNAIHVIAPVEMVIVAHKGEWNLQRRGAHNLEHDEWLTLTNGLWTFSGTSRDDHPAPFPEELPRRCITLLSFLGDTILDPFLGSGTTAVVGRRLGRVVYGFDHSPRYIEQARARIAESL